MTQAVAILALAVPALIAVLWPLLRRAGDPVAEGPGAPAADRRLELVEERDTIYRALRELAFDHESGLIEDDDYRELRARYEGRAAEVLHALDALAPVAAEPLADAAAPHPAPAPAAARAPARSPAMLAAAAVAVLVFGVVLGVSIGRFTEPDQSAGGMAGNAPAIAPGPMVPAPPGGSGPAGGGSGKPIAPEMLAGMLRAARQSLAEGRYQEAIAAYQAVLKRQPDNVDAMTHLGLIVAIGGHADSALETWDKALRIDPDYAPAYLYRGEVLYEVKRDYPAAIESWRRFVALVPSGQDHDRVQEMIRQAQAKPAAR